MIKNNLECKALSLPGIEGGISRFALRSSEEDLC